MTKAKGAPFFRPGRAAIETAIEHLITALDVLDGEPDCEDDDPAGDICDRGEPEPWRCLPLPAYGIDQSAGPLNEDEAWHAYRAWQSAGELPPKRLFANSAT